MARLSNSQIDNMSLNQCKTYSLEHPSEALRVSRRLVTTSIDCGKIAVQYAANKAFSPNPESITIKL